MINTQVNTVSCPKAYLIKKHNLKGLHPLLPAPVTFLQCPSLKSPAARKIATNALKCRQMRPVCRSGGEARSGNESQEPLWKSFGKVLGNFGKNSSVEDVLRKQIEKRDYYDEGGNPPGGGRGGSGGGGGSSFGGSEEEGLPGILDETIQVIMATLGFIFVYMYIINGAEMTLLAKDYLKFIFTGKKSFRLVRVFEEWESFCGDLLSKKEPEDQFWLERAIIRTPTWWDHPEKYKRILASYLRTKYGQSIEREQDQEEEQEQENQNVYYQGSMSDDDEF